MICLVQIIAQVVLIMRTFFLARQFVRLYGCNHLEIELKSTLQKLRMAFEVESIQTAVSIIEL